MFRKDLLKLLLTQVCTLFTKSYSFYLTFCVSVYVANFDKYQMRKIRSTIPSIPGLLEKLRRDPSNIELSMAT